MEEPEYAWTLDRGMDRDWSMVSILLQQSDTVTCIADAAAGGNYRDTWGTGLEAAEELYRVYRQYELDDPAIEYRANQSLYVVEATYAARDGKCDGVLRLVGTLADDFAP